MKSNIISLILMFAMAGFNSVSGQWTKNFIDNNISTPASMDADDIDGDGDPDIAATIYGETDLVWYENNNTSFTKHIIDNQSGGVGVTIADVNGNDTLDVVVAGYTEGLITWYKNTGGLQ